MILRLIHAAASHAWVYDCIQTVVGASNVHSRLAQLAPPTAPSAYVLDLGGGTGSMRRHWPANCRYVTLDFEYPKLTGLLRKAPGSLVLQGDATRLPVATGSIDTVVCTLVAHHLSEEMLQSAVEHCWRVLRPGGFFLFADALRRPDRWLSCLMWSLDRGTYPYEMTRLKTLISERFDIIHCERFAIYHDYVLFAARKAGAD